MKKIILIIILLFELFIVFYSKELIKEFSLTINICLYSLMPTLFFQIFFSDLLYSLKDEIKIPKLILNFFKISKDDFFIYLISIFSGYPNNIKLLIDNKNEYLLYSTNFINPLFLFVTVGSLYLKNIKMCIIIYICHFISNIIMLIIYKNKNNISIIINNKKLNYPLTLKNTINTLSIIFSNLLVISLLITFLKVVLPFNNTINTFILGILEFSRGIYEISLSNNSIYLKGILILIIITFGSFSIHFQSICINNKIKYIKFLLNRILNVFISILLYFILIFIYTNL